MSHTNINNLDSQLAKLVKHAPKEIAPEQDLWLGIEKQLDKSGFQQTNSKRSQQWRRLAVASILLLTGVLGSNLWQANMQPTTEGSALLTTLADIRLQHQQQVEQLSLQQHVNWQASQFSDPLEEGIKQLRKAAEQIYQALQQSPNDKELWQLWLWTQAKEIELLQQGQSLPVTPLSQGALI